MDIVFIIVVVGLLFCGAILMLIKAQCHLEYLRFTKPDKFGHLRNYFDLYDYREGFFNLDRFLLPLPYFSIESRYEQNDIANQLAKKVKYVIRLFWINVFVLILFVIMMFTLPSIYVLS
jgi:hypothetical protein